MDIIIYSISFLFEHLKYLILYKYILKIPFQNNKIAYITVPLFSILMTFVYFETGYGTKCIVYLVLLLLQSYIFLKEKWNKVHIDCFIGYETDIRQKI